MHSLITFSTVYTKKGIQTVLIVTKLVFIKACAQDQRETGNQYLKNFFFFTNLPPSHRSLIHLAEFECFNLISQLFETS